MDRFVAVFFLVADNDDDGVVFPPIIGQQLLEEELGVSFSGFLAFGYRHLFYFVLCGFFSEGTGTGTRTT